MKISRRGRGEHLFVVYHAARDWTDQAFSYDGREKGWLGGRWAGSAAESLESYLHSRKIKITESRMIPAIRLVKVSSQRAESSLATVTFVESYRNAFGERSEPEFPLIPVLPRAIATPPTSLCEGFSARFSAESVVRLLAQNAVSGSWGRKLWLQVMGFPWLFHEWVDTEGEIQPLGPA